MKKKLRLFIKEWGKSYENAKDCYICKKKKKKKKNENKYLEDIKYKKVRDHCHYTFKIQCA